MTQIRFLRFPVLLCGVILSLGTACTPGAVRDRLGIESSSPDEFAVIRRAPLQVDHTILSGEAALPDPQLGLARPQESAPDQMARQVLLGQDKKAQDTDDLAQQTLSDGDSAFLKRTGADQAEPDVRSRISAETQELRDRNKPVAERLFDINGDRDISSASVVDAQAEAQRIRENLTSGRLVTEGETPSKEE